MIKINIATVNGFNTEELKKVHAAQLKLNKILNTEKFKQYVLRFTTDGLFRFYYRKSLFGKWIDIPYTNQQVYEMLTQQTVDNDGEVKQIDFHLEMLPGGDVEQFGYTNHETQKIFTYRNWFNNLSLPGYTSHLAHEWCH